MGDVVVVVIQIFSVLFVVVASHYYCFSSTDVCIYFI